MGHWSACGRELLERPFSAVRTSSKTCPALKLTTSWFAQTMFTGKLTLDIWHENGPSRAAHHASNPPSRKSAVRRVYTWKFSQRVTFRWSFAHSSSPRLQRETYYCSSPLPPSPNHSFTRCHVRPVHRVPLPHRLAMPRRLISLRSPACTVLSNSPGISAKTPSQVRFCQCPNEGLCDLEPRRV